SVYLSHHHPIFTFFFFNHTAPTEISTLSLHDALPISRPGTVSLTNSTLAENAACTGGGIANQPGGIVTMLNTILAHNRHYPPRRSEEHTSELQSLTNIVCRLLLEKKKKNNKSTPIILN